MKFLILNTDYPEFLRWLYREHPGLDSRSYDEQMATRNESLFGVADFYSSNLRKLGHEAWDIHANNEPMQKAWAREHGVKFSERAEWKFRLRRGIVPWFSRVEDCSWFYEILAAQIDHYKPDIVWNQAIGEISGVFLKRIKPRFRFLLGQTASPFPREEEFGVYDLMISALPSHVEYFLDRGVRAELSRLGFEPAILTKLENRGQDIPVSFIGTVSSVHQARTSLLEHLCSGFDIQIWGKGADGMQDAPLIRKRCRPPAWGLEMYQILGRSKMTLNNHSEIAGPHACNMRLFEATGAGTLLITDWKEDLHETFEPGKEVVAYRNTEECAQLIRYYLDHEEERKAVARAGQQRTLREHTYGRRVEEVLELLSRYL